MLCEEFNKSQLDVVINKLVNKMKVLRSEVKEDNFGKVFMDYLIRWFDLHIREGLPVKLWLDKPKWP